MSIDMYLADSLTQASSTSHFCQKQVTDYQNLQQAMTQFTLQTPNLKGKAYDAAKAYFSQVLYPLVQGGILFSEAVEKAAKRFPQEYINQVDSISLKQSELEAQIRQMNQYITQAEGIRQLLLSPYMPEEHQGFQLSQNTLLLTMYHDLKQKLEEKLQKLLDYNQSSAQFFTEIKSLEQAVNQGLAQTKTAWNSQTKTFSMPKDLSWTTTIQDKWQQAENEKKGIDPTKNKELEKYNVYALIIHDSEGNPRVFWKIEDKQSGHGIVNPELYQYVTKVGHYLDPELIQFMTYDTYQEKVNTAWRQGVNYETGEKLDPLLGSIVSTSQYVKDGYTWINESELGQALMVLGFTYASYKVLTTTGVKQVENGKIDKSSSDRVKIPEKSLKHADMGDFTINPSTGKISKMKSGGHGQANIAFLEENGFEVNIEKIYPNGVRIGNVPDHKVKAKRTGGNQSWFPENWTNKDIENAGQYIANQKNFVGAKEGEAIFGEFNGVRVGVIKNDGKPATIFPDATRQP
ncbi:EndoU domain-containing protein [Enterococcus mundtii]|uniref:EndoU domain-containing protein n=1 Tax=Enterococcus mundtii TaxID=53346 RepID=UPI000DFD3846|nr:EndoU domain-containing protein [Enterococcus mundtii]STD21156.1 Bacillus transposase protein [Enterococcus mundtii]